MSGGVDSSVAAALLAREGHEVIGLSMQLYDHSGSHADGEVRFGSCCTIDDLHDARRVAGQLGIPHYIVNFERQFDETVVSNFVREYASGRTPIPCVHCNGDLKFATLAARAEGLGARLVATGHYARVERRGRRAVLAQARRRSREGSVVFSLHADAGSALARALPGRCARQDGCPRARARARSRRLREARQPRDLLRRRRRPQCLSRIATALSAPPAPSATPPAASSARTTACTASRSDSERALDCRRGFASTSWTSTPAKARSLSGHGKRSSVWR